VDNTAPKPQVPESFLEYRQVFMNSWVDRWVFPNPFIQTLIPVLRDVGVELSDYSFNNNPANFGEIYLNIAIRKFSAGVRISLDSITFVASNPHWAMVSELIPVLERVSSSIRTVVGEAPKQQEATLAFHVTAGTADFKRMSSSLVNREMVGESMFYGVSLYRGDAILIIDKSLRHEGAAFVRVQRQFPGDVSLSEVAKTIYADELNALGMLGIKEIP
jgi:hypothetical protein